MEINPIIHRDEIIRQLNLQSTISEEEKTWLLGYIEGIQKESSQLEKSVVFNEETIAEEIANMTDEEFEQGINRLRKIFKNNADKENQIEEAKYSLDLLWKDCFDSELKFNYQQMNFILNSINEIKRRLDTINQKEK